MTSATRDTAQEAVFRLNTALHACNLAAAIERTYTQGRTTISGGEGLELTLACRPDGVAVALRGCSVVGLCLSLCVGGEYWGRFDFADDAALIPHQLELSPRQTGGVSCCLSLRGHRTVILGVHQG